MIERTIENESKTADKELTPMFLYEREAGIERFKFTEPCVCSMNRTAAASRMSVTITGSAILKIFAEYDSNIMTESRNSSIL
jgi:hypothetical protein